MIEFRWQEAMPSSVPRKKADLAVSVAPLNDGVRGAAKGSFDEAFFDIGQTVHGVETGSADHSDGRGG